MFGHSRPVFAATAAVVCLAAGLGGRARQAVDLLVGVLIGLLSGQLVAQSTETPGPVTTLLAVLAALAVVSLIDAHPLALIQAASSALLVLTLPSAGTAFQRWADAAVGGAIGLLGSQVLFAPDPVRLVVGPARAVLADVATALRADDPADAAVQARHAAAGLGELAAARNAAHDVASRTVRGRLRRSALRDLLERLTDVELLVAATTLAVDPAARQLDIPASRRYRAAEVADNVGATLMTQRDDVQALTAAARSLLTIETPRGD